jgi:hypothetical protein
MREHADSERSMNWTLFFQLAGTLAVALSGGWLGHYLSSRRNLMNERRRLRVQYLLEAYRRLEARSNWRAIESAVADIQLLGSPTQVELARTFALEMVERGSAKLDPFCTTLERRFDAELYLEAVYSPVIYFRGPRSAPNQDEN